MDDHRASGGTRGEAVMFPERSKSWCVRRGQRRNQNAPRKYRVRRRSEREGSGGRTRTRKNAARRDTRLGASAKLCAIETPLLRRMGQVVVSVV